MDALDVVQSMPSHPSTAEFISIKLIQRFVSDEISLVSFQDQSAPIELREQLADCLAAWFSTDPPGNIQTVMRTILDPDNRTSAFWSDLAYRSKVKTPVELINSTLRVLEADASGNELPCINDEMGMHFFTRDDPDGWSELGFDWIDTSSMLNRIIFVQELAENRGGTDFGWSSLEFLDSRGLMTAQQIVDFVSDLFFEGTLTQVDKDLLIEFLNTNENGDPQPLNHGDASTFQTKIEEFFGLVLSMPQWQFQ